MMNDEVAKQILDKIIAQVFGYANPFTLQQAIEKFAFDIKLPVETYDATDGSNTWVLSLSPGRFIKMENVRKRSKMDDYMIPKQPVTTMDDITRLWAETNLFASERYIEAINIAKSDMVYNSENIYMSSDAHYSKNVLCSETVRNCEVAFGVRRSHAVTNSLRVTDSDLVSNSFNVIWSGKIDRGIFINDCYDVVDCMFCSHLQGKRFCIANMQFEEEEYTKIRDMAIRWILTS